MRITLNGAPTEVDDGASVADLVAVQAAGPRRAAVALNGAVVPRSAWSATRLSNEDSVEILIAVAGG